MATLELRTPMAVAQTRAMAVVGIGKSAARQRDASSEGLRKIYLLSAISVPDVSPVHNVAHGESTWVAPKPGTGLSKNPALRAWRLVPARVRVTRQRRPEAQFRLVGRRSNGGGFLLVAGNHP